MIRLFAVLAVAFVVLIQAIPGTAEALQTVHPTLSTFALPTSTVGSAVADTAILAGPTSPTGSITFNLYGAGDTSCTGPVVFTSTKPAGLRTTSDPYTTPQAGVYRWVAAYSGDATNFPATGSCGEQNETVTVSPATPSVTAFLQGTAQVGGSLTGTATLSDAYRPSGTITFTIYDVNDPTCAGPPVFSQTVPFAPQTTSTPYNPPTPGTYRLIAGYSGDPSNMPAHSACGDPRATVTVTGQVLTPITAQLGLPPVNSAPSGCVPQAIARKLVEAIVAALTGRAGSAFKDTCGGSVVIILRSREIRPGFLGIPNRDGYTNIGGARTKVSPTGQVAFSINAQGIGLRRYAKTTRASLLVFVIVEIRPGAQQPPAESISAFTLR